MKHNAGIMVLLFILLPGVAHAWWNEDWSFRKKISFDTTQSGASVDKDLLDIPVLVRLHTGNFGYFLDVKADGSDIRFIASDDKTPLKFHIEKFDPLNEMALIWVKVPRLLANTTADNIWMYYGNQSAVAGADVGGTFDVKQTAVYHFANGQVLPQDSTAYANHAAQTTAELVPASLISAGLKLSGTANMILPANPNLAINPQNGFTFSSWIRIESVNSDSIIFTAGNESHELLIGHDQSGLYARINSDATLVAEVRAPALVINTWQQLTFTLGDNQMKLFVDGAQVGTADIALTEPLFNREIIGSSLEGDRFLTAELDEVRLANIARIPAWIAARNQAEGQLGRLVSYGEDESGKSESSSYIGIIMRNVTVDGWVVVIILAIMAVISWVLMVMKGMFIMRAYRDNVVFMNDYRKLGASDPSKLDAEENAEEVALLDSPLSAALFGKHDHYQSSPLYHIYHRGIQEVQTRVGRSVSAQASGRLSLQSLNAVRAALDASLVRESQKLNKLMVLLTIAISGGPFLGLLGTVVGVMITFAAIAAAGDVNINAIAPGIAAALLATVAGLVVAIPALFGYNYLGSRVKDMVAEMRVFVDEFVTRVGEYYSEK